jgi:glycosyltransferase involved in cell wall biosynthesis
MKILKIWDADYPWDIRVKKICRSLASEGHEVHLLCRNLKNLLAYEKWQYGHIHRLPFFIGHRVNYLFSFPAFFNPLWVFSAWRLVKKYKLDLILVRDLPLSLTAVTVGHLSSRPVVWDMAENYPFLVDDIWRYEPFRLHNWLVRNPFLVRQIEKIAFNVVDHIVVVIEESKERLVKQGVEKGKISIVSNTPDLSSFPEKSLELSKSDQDIFENRFVVIYVGGLEIARGLDYVVDAIPEILKKIPNFLFLILGKGNAEEGIRKKVKQRGISQHVLLRGWVDFDSVASFIQRSDVGVIPHHVTAHTNHTIPNKLFDYMLQGKPVVASAAKPMIRILDENRCGMTFTDVHSLAEVFKKLYDPDVRDRMGRNGKEAVYREYNWRNDARVLNSAFEKLFSKKNGKEKRCIVAN